MLLLCSNGLSSTNLRNQIRQILRNSSTAALVVTADDVYKERNHYVGRCIRELGSLNLTVDLFDLDTQPAENLLHYDVVEYIGGNPFYLLHSIRQHHAEHILHTIAEERLLIGWSAAAFVFGPTLALVNTYSPQMNFPGLTDLTALALTDQEVLPHYSRFCSKFDRFEERCCEYERQHHVDVIRLNDGDGLLIDQNGKLLIRA